MTRAGSTLVPMLSWTDVPAFAFVVVQEVCSLSAKSQRNAAYLASVDRALQLAGAAASSGAGAAAGTGTGMEALPALTAEALMPRWATVKDVAALLTRRAQAIHSGLLDGSISVQEVCVLW